MTIAIYPGTFDPITSGHINILTKATHLFDTVILAVANVTSKNTMFTTDERYELCKVTTAHIPGVSVEAFDSLTVDFAEKRNAKHIIRGLRFTSDFEYELQISLMNKKLNPDIETIFFIPDEHFLHVSSSMVRQIVGLGGSLKDFIPDVVEQAIRGKLRS